MTKKLKETKPSTVKLLYQIMYDVHQILVNNGLKYWADGGTFLGAIRHSGIIPWDDDLDIGILSKDIKKVAVLGGSGSFAIKNAIAAGADVFLTADLKYHQFYEAENKLLLADIGHFESERYTKNYIVDFLKEKITNFAIILSELNTNPVKYF